MSYTSKTPLLIGRGTLTFEGHTFQGKPVKVTFLSAIALDADAMVYCEEQDDNVIMGDNAPIVVRSGPVEKWVEINLRLLDDPETGRTFMIEHPTEENDD